jgi:hypothetical protein
MRASALLDPAEFMRQEHMAGPGRRGIAFRLSQLSQKIIFPFFIN